MHGRNPGLGGGQCSHRRVLRHAHLQQLRYCLNTSSLLYRLPPAPQMPVATRSAEPARALQGFVTPWRTRKIRRSQMRQFESPCCATVGSLRTNSAQIKPSITRSNTAPQPPQGRHAVLAGAGTPSLPACEYKPPQRWERAVIADQESEKRLQQAAVDRLRPATARTSSQNRQAKPTRASSGTFKSPSGNRQRAIDTQHWRSSSHDPTCLPKRSRAWPEWAVRLPPGAAAVPADPSRSSASRIAPQHDRSKTWAVRR